MPFQLLILIFCFFPQGQHIYPYYPLEGIILSQGNIVLSSTPSTTPLEKPLQLHQSNLHKGKRKKEKKLVTIIQKQLADLPTMLFVPTANLSGFHVSIIMLTSLLHL
jgi:hypothetical protein